MPKTITINPKALQDTCLTQQKFPQAVLDKLQEHLVLSLGDVSKPAHSKPLIYHYPLGLYVKKGLDWLVFAKLNPFRGLLALKAKNDKNHPI